MIINGKEAHSKGKDIVYIYGDRTWRAVYQVKGEQKFFIKANGEYIEVYPISMGYSTTNSQKKEQI